MLSEDFDKKIREAADHHHPAYDERAWKEMKKMLDKHLPEKEEKRRRFLFWWLLPLLLGGAGLLVFKPWQKNSEKPMAANEQVDKPGQEVLPGETNNPENETERTAARPEDAGSITAPAQNSDEPPVAERSKTSGENNTVSSDKDPVPVRKDIRVNMKSSDLTKTQKPQKNGQPVSVQPPVVSPVVKDTKDGIPGKTGEVPVKSTEPVKKQPGQIIADNSTTTPQNDKPDPATTVKPANPGQPDPGSKGPVTTPVASAKDKKQEETKTPVKEKAKPKKTARSFFFLSLSGGADVSFVSGNRTGAVKPVIGGGLGYTFKEKFTLRTGFYSARKVYTADGDSYKPSAAFTQYYPYLVNVDANCQVYEIPVSLSYNFGRKNNSNWFASVGLSTLLMKSEAYNYQYKYTPTGNIYSRDWTIKNENKHYFSVATLSAGYTRSVGKKFLVMAEPYVKVPLGGVGFGKVKLNSGGVLVTVGFKPFAK